MPAKLQLAAPLPVWDDNSTNQPVARPVISYSHTPYISLKYHYFPNSTTSTGVTGCGHVIASSLLTLNLSFALLGCLSALLSACLFCFNDIIFISFSVRLAYIFCVCHQTFNFLHYLTSTAVFPFNLFLPFSVYYVYDPIYPYISLHTPISPCISLYTPLYPYIPLYV